MNVDRDSFGPYLRGERERRGLTLEGIADSTKIKRSLLAALERSDVSQWPSGIFRRAFMREYASAIGLPPEPVVAELTRLFPDEEFSSDFPHDIQAADPGNSDPRVPAALEACESAAAPVIRMRTAVFDISAVFLISGLIAAVSGASIWLAVAGVAVGYATLGTACLEQSAGTWLLKRSDAWLNRAQPQPQIASSLIRDLPLVASRNQRHADVRHFNAKGQSGKPARKAPAQ
jgi:transcriptional regulator with XRE-family HTH domain